MKKLFLFLALLFLSVPGWSATYYVRTDGHNTASGLNDTNNTTTGAWLTIGKGASTASAGDTVIINDGTYAEGLVTFSRSGSAGNMIYFRAANNRKAQLIGGIKITGNFVKVEGLKIAYVSGISTSPAWVTGKNNEIGYNWIENPRGAGGIRADGAHNILYNNYITNPQLGIQLSGDYNVARNNEVSGLTWWGVGFDDADYSRFSGTGHSLINNYFHGADPDALFTQHGSHVDCFQTFEAGGAASSVDILIDGNICYDTHQGLIGEAIDRGESTGLTIRNNVFVNQKSWGLILINMQDVNIYNNVFYNGTLMGVGALGSTTISAIKNNIFYNAASGTLKPIYFVDNTSTFYPYNGASISNASKNLLYRNQGEGSNTLNQGIYPNDIVNLNPNFVSSSDFRLQAGSPAIDKGSTISGFSSDILGVSRPQGVAWDIGPYELIKIPPVIAPVIPPVIPKSPNSPGNIMVN